VDPDGERDEERAGEEEHLVSAEVPPRQPHGHEQHDARRDHARLRRGRNHRPARPGGRLRFTPVSARASGEAPPDLGRGGAGSRAARDCAGSRRAGGRRGVEVREVRLSPTAGLKFGDLFVVCVSIKEIGHVPKRELLQQRAQKESPTHGLFVSRAGDEIFAGDEGAGFVHIAGLAKWRDYILAPGCV